MLRSFAGTNLEVESTLDALVQKGLAARPPAGDPLDGSLALTEHGAEVADLLLGTVRDRLEKLLDGWSPDQYSELGHLLNQFAAEVIPAREPLNA